MEFHSLPGRIVYGDGTTELACVDFPQVEQGIVDINHTFVDESLRGQGMAGQLMQRCADQLRKDGLRAKTGCSYAEKWFEKHPEYSDVLAEK
ncbi:MAG: N-acetyltransferase [Candidatus Fournierella pullistercoris]|uniref:N-acetyltransferase n=1 Tax=Candidatus Allofournierella pullistercoris TaxID=2838597 RepID=A0A948WS73_9FIRM|nr:N-acetyltransferase [Candidatus Fournierella pullistercoris]